MHIPIKYSAGGGRGKTWINLKTMENVIATRFGGVFHKVWGNRNVTSRATGC